MISPRTYYAARFVCSLLGSFTLTLVLCLALGYATCEWRVLVRLNTLVALHCTAGVISAMVYMQGLASWYYNKTLPRAALFYYGYVATLGFAELLFLSMVGVTHALHWLLRNLGLLLT